MRSRRIVVAAVAAFCLSGGVAACGGTSSDQLAHKIDQTLENQGGSSAPEPTQATAQEQADQDMRDAAEAQRRRKELANLEKVKAAEAKKVATEGVPGGNDADITYPLGTADPAVAKFRAQLTGVCEGGQTRLSKVTAAANKAKKSKDPAALLKVAQDYTSALTDFQSALDDLDAPASEKATYTAWLATIGALSTNIRVQLVSQGDPKAAAKYQARTTRLAAKFLEQSATLGVTCLSVVS